MPGQRDPNKVIVTLWTHQKIYDALKIASSVSGTTLTRYVLEAVAQKIGCSLDADGNPVGLDVGKLAETALAQQRAKKKALKKA